MGAMEQLDDAQLGVWPLLTINLSGGEEGWRAELILLTVFKPSV